mgnify:CR=1 FL=1
MKFGVITFPGSNSDEDAFLAVADVFGQECVKLWHKDHDLRGVDVVILPVASATATTCVPARSRASRPIMREVVAHRRTAADR